MPISSQEIENAQSTNATGVGLNVRQSGSRETFNLNGVGIQNITIAEYHYYFEFFQPENERKQKREYIVPYANYRVTGVEMKYDENANLNYYLLHLYSSVNPRIKAARYYPDSGYLSDAKNLHPLSERSPLRGFNVLSFLFKYFGITLRDEQVSLLGTFQQVSWLPHAHNDNAHTNLARQPG